MCLAAAIAGIGFDQVGLVLTHAMAHPLSGRFGVPHGVACALLTPPVMAFNAIAAPGATGRGGAHPRRAARPGQDDL